MTEDDDLPVLTQVLRTGTLRQSAAIEARFATAVAGARPYEATPAAEPLVVGNEPREAVGADHVPTARSTDRDAADGGVDAGAVAADPPDDDGEATRPHAPDAFLLPQDHDGRATVQPSTLDLPEFDASTPPVTADVAATQAATETATLPESPAEVPAVEARRFRDAVIDDLRTRIDTELDARIAQALHLEVETVLAQLQQNLRTRLSDALLDVVAKAVDDAIARRGDDEAPIA